MWQLYITSINIKLILLAGLLPLPLLLSYWKKKKYDEKLLQLKQKSDEYWYQFIFVTNDNIKCTEHLKKEFSCGETCSHNFLQRITEHLSLAKTSLSICVYHITLHSILHELLEAHKRDVKVRIITDREMAHHASSIIQDLVQEGIPVKIQPDTTSLMHHKFFLVDEYTDNKEVWFGSLNLTGQGLTTNWDNMIYTNNPSMISRFSENFELLWEAFTGKLYSDS